MFKCLLVFCSFGIILIKGKRGEWWSVILRNVFFCSAEVD